MTGEDNAINWLHEIEDVKEKSLDPLADEVMRRFNGAVSWQSTERVNGKPLRDVLQECWEQQNGVLSCEDQKIADALGVHAIINITALKTSVAKAYMADSLVSGTTTLPWVVLPTPRPDLSPVAKDEVLNAVKAQMFMGGGYPSPELLVEHIRELKTVAKRKEKETAQKASEEMMSLMEDQCTEGGFNRALGDFLQYFPVYPYAVFAGPYIIRAPRLTWGTNKPRLQTEVFPVWRAISPFDFCYSPDSPDTQRGTCVFTRTLWTRRSLLDAAKLPSYFSKNVLEVLKSADINPDFDLNWLSRSPDDSKRDLTLWSSNVAPIEVLTHYGVMSGRELSKYHISGLEDTEFYNCEIAMAGYRVIQVKVMRDPHVQSRPIYTASFYKTGGDKIAGDGIAQRLRDIERGYHLCYMSMIRNAANASEPICEADYRRLAKYMSDSDLGTITPGTMYLVDSDATNSNVPALRFSNVPSNLPAYMQIMEALMQLADRMTNIPASLHGEAVGSGALRTFRGMATLQGNATKALQSAVNNIATDIFAPMGELLYNLNMIYAEDDSVRGDSHITTKGAEGLLAKEIDKQNAMEIIQLVAQAGAQIASVAGMNIAPALMWAFEKLLHAQGIPDDVLAQMKQPSPQQMQAAQQQTQQQGNGANPNPNSEGGPASQGVEDDVAGL